VQCRPALHSAQKWAYDVTVNTCVLLCKHKISIGNRRWRYVSNVDCVMYIYRVCIVAFMKCNGTTLADLKNVVV